jgi:hypothetical protein
MRMDFIAIDHDRARAGETGVASDHLHPELL